MGTDESQSYLSVKVADVWAVQDAVNRIYRESVKWARLRALPRVRIVTLTQALGDHTRRILTTSTTDGVFTLTVVTMRHWLDLLNRLKNAVVSAQVVDNSQRTFALMWVKKARLTIMGYIQLSLPL